MIGPKLPAGWVSPRIRRHRELQNLRKMIDGKATLWHHEWMQARAAGETNRQRYALGMADAFSEAFHALSVMRGYPWA